MPKGKYVLGRAQSGGRHGIVVAVIGLKNINELLPTPRYIIFILNLLALRATPFIVISSDM